MKLSIVALISSVFIYGIVQSATYPLLALRLESADVSRWLIGINAGMMPVGMLIAGLISPMVIRRYGLYLTIQLGLLFVSVCLLLIYIYHHYFAWLILRFITGIILTFIFVVTDTCVNAFSEDRIRGRVLGLYSMSLSLGFVLGPVLLTSFGSSSDIPFYAIIILPLLAILPILAVQKEIKGIAYNNKSISMAATAWEIRPLLLGVVIVSAADQGALSLLPSFGLQLGLDETASNFLVVMMTLGSFTLMYPIGWLADSMDRIRLMIVCSVLSMLCLMVFIPVANSVLGLSAIIFIWGGVYYAIYSLTLVRIGQRFNGSQLVAANAACGAAWGVGGFIGTPAIGMAMDQIGWYGLPSVLLSFFLLLSIVLHLSRRVI